MENQPERRMKAVDWIALGAILGLAVFYTVTLGQVPFHPDESTHLYMSKDLFTFFKEPLELSWSGGLPLAGDERIRAIDAPLAKYLIGTARGIFSIPPLGADWDWSASWAENGAAGALPDSRQLFLARAAVSLSMAAGLWFFYRALARSFSGYASLTGIVLLGLNPLVLLHGRRAMSEGILLFAVAFFLWTAVKEKKQAWLIGLAFALAMNAKHTAIALLPAALYAVISAPGRENPPGRWMARVVQFTLVVVALTGLGNPFYWQHPIQALKIGLGARLELSRQQQIDHLGGWEQDQLTPGRRAAALLANTLITPLQTEETGNYTIETQEARQDYLSRPLYSWGRGVVWGGSLLVLALVGLALTIKRLPSSPEGERSLILVWILSTLGMVLALAIPLPWQRYVLPLLPLMTFWEISGLVPGVEALRKLARSA